MKIEIYTDGACSGNPGKGGYGIVMRVPDKNYEKKFSEGFRLTTNNRMELLAVIEAFKKLKSPQKEVEIYTDSKYVSDAVNKNWIDKWKKKGYEKIKNPDLWKMFENVSKNHGFTLHWIKGHSGNPYNEQADQLAVKASQLPQLQTDEYFENEQKIVK